MITPNEKPNYFELGGLMALEMCTLIKLWTSLGFNRPKYSRMLMFKLNKNRVGLMLWSERLFDIRFTLVQNWYLDFLCVHGSWSAQLLTADWTVKNQQLDLQLIIFGNLTTSFLLVTNSAVCTLYWNLPFNLLVLRFLPS